MAPNSPKGNSTQKGTYSHRTHVRPKTRSRQKLGKETAISKDPTGSWIKLLNASFTPTGHETSGSSHFVRSCTIDRWMRRPIVGGDKISLMVGRSLGAAYCALCGEREGGLNNWCDAL